MMEQKTDRRWNMEGKLRINGGAYLTSVLIGVASAALLLLTLSLAAAAAVYFSPLSEDVLSTVALFIDGAASLCGGFMAARCSGRRGLIMGASVGGILLLFTLLLGGSGGNAAAQTGVCLLSALAGGVLGVR